MPINMPPRPFLRKIGQENPIFGEGGQIITSDQDRTPTSEVPELQKWDANGDVYVPRNAGAEAYVPASEAAPPQRPSPLERVVPMEFEPHGVQAFMDVALTPRAPTALGFMAHAVLVDNLSNKWIYFPSAMRYVPPSTVGVMLTLIPGTQVAQWTQQTPAGHADGANGAGGPITSVWYEDYIWASAGVGAPV